MTVTKTNVTISLTQPNNVSLDCQVFRLPFWMAWQYYVTEFRQPLQVQSHLDMLRILVQLGHIQRTKKLAHQTNPKWSPTRSVTRYQD